MWKLKEHEIRTKFEEIEELVDVEASNLWKSFKKNVQKACDKLCKRRIVRMNQVIRCGK